MKQRNYSIDFLKLYFALIIAVWHTPFPASFPVFDTSYVVCMFFILSGYFLVASFDSGKYRNPWDYTMNRVSRIYPYYFAAFLVMYLYTQRNSGLRTLVPEFFRSVPEMLMVQNTGIFSAGLNYPLWQLSALIVVSHILFALLGWNRQVMLNAVCPVVGICALNYYLRVHVRAELPGSPFVETALLRAAAGLCLGMTLYEPVKRVLKHLEESSCRCIPVVVSAVSLFLLPVLWTNRMTYNVLLPFVGIMICMLYSRSIWANLFRSSKWRWMDRLSLGIYVNHAVVARIFEEHQAICEGIPLPADLVYLAVLIPYCIAMMWLTDRLVALGKKAAAGAV